MWQKCSHDINALSLPFIDDVVAAQEEDEVVTQDFYEAATDVDNALPRCKANKQSIQYCCGHGHRGGVKQNPGPKPGSKRAAPDDRRQARPRGCKPFPEAHGLHEQPGALAPRSKPYALRARALLHLQY